MQAELKNTIVMETMTRTVQITLPLADASFLRRLSSNMGWQIATQRNVVRHHRPTKTGYYESEQFYKDIDEAEQDIAQGKGVRVSSKQELDALFL